MAKIVKKKPAVKAAAKTAKKAPAKAALKPAPKKAAPKAIVKKKVEKAPVKVAKKPELKKKPEVKPVAAKVVPKPTKEVKEAKVEIAKKPEKKPLPQPVVVASAVSEKAPIKKDAKAPKKGKGKKEETADIEEDFISDDDIMGDEIGEYEEELKAVEEADEEAEVEIEWTAEERARTDEEVILTDAEGRRYCRARDCDQIASVDAYCRYHYLLFWKKIQVRKKILADGKLERYVEELTSRYPDKFLEMIRRDLRTEKDFLAAIQELEIDESATENEFEEDTSAYLEEVRGMGENSSTGVDDDEY